MRTLARVRRAALPLLAGAAALAATAASAETPACVDWSETVHWVGGLSWGQYPLSQSGGAVEILGDIAYVAADEEDLQIVSLADPAQPEVVSFRGFAGSINSLELAGTTLALGWNRESSGSVVLYDVGNPAVPMLRGSVAYGDNYGIGVNALIDGRAVVAVYREGIYVVDVHDIDHPVKLGRLEPSVDFSPFVEITTSPVPYAYACEKNFGLAIYDFSTSLPTRRPEALPGIWTRVAHQEGSSVAYLAGVTEDAELVVASLDVSDPLSPVLLDVIMPTCVRPCIAASASWPSPRGIFVDGGRVVVAASGGNLLVNASDPHDLVADGTFLGLRTTIDLEFHGEYLVLGETYRGLNVYEADAFHTVEPVAEFTVTSQPPNGNVSVESVLAIGDYAYLSEFTTVPDGYGFSDWVRTEVVDLTDPTGPVSVNVIDHPGNEASQAIWETAAGIYGAQARSLHAISLADPVNPVVTGSADAAVPLGEYLWITDVATAGSRLFAAADGYTGSGSLLEYDITDPAQPAFLSRLPLPDRGSGIAVREGYAYVAATTAGLQIADISVSPPALVGSVATGGRAVDVEIEGSVAFVALGQDYNNLGEAGVAVLDLSTPDAPVLLDAIAVPQAAHDVEVADGIVYVASEWAGITVLDARDPANVTVRGAAPTRVRPEGLAISDHGVLAWAWWSFDAVAPDCATGAATSSPVVTAPFPWRPRIFPNPTVGETEILLGVLHGTAARATVYDVRGRRVRDLTLETGAGRTRAHWAGVDERGNPVPSGVYFVRVVAGPRSGVGRIVLRR